MVPADCDLFMADEVHSFATGDSSTLSYELEVVGPLPFKVTLVWTDPPSNPLAAASTLCNSPPTHHREAAPQRPGSSGTDGTSLKHDCAQEIEPKCRYLHIPESSTDTHSPTDRQSPRRKPTPKMSAPQLRRHIRAVGRITAISILLSELITFVLLQVLVDGQILAADG